MEGQDTSRLDASDLLLILDKLVVVAVIHELQMLVYTTLRHFIGVPSNYYTSLHGTHSEKGYRVWGEHCLDFSELLAIVLRNYRGHQSIPPEGGWNHDHSISLEF